MHNSSSFFKGVGAGLVAGVSLGMAVAPKKKSHNFVSKALKAAGELVDNVSNVMG